MKALKKAMFFVRECVEVYIPVISFVVLFSVFIFQVFMRYVVRNPQSWTSEIESMMFLWLVLLGACYAQRSKSHVTFTLIYDKLGAKGKALTALLGNLIIGFTFAVAIVPTWKFILFQGANNQVTSILKISKTVVYMPYMLFLVFILIYTIADIVLDVRVLAGNQAAEAELLETTKSEVELAIESAEESDTDFENNRREENK